MSNNFVEDTAEDALNVTTQTLTGGMIGYGDGKFEAGVTGEPALEVTRRVVGEITGTAELVRQAEMAEARLEQEDMMRERQLADDRVRQERVDRAASMRAQAIRGSGMRSGSNQTIGGSRDFLGL